MSGHARTADDQRVNRPRRGAGGTTEQPAWIKRVFGIGIETTIALDPQTTTSQDTIEQASPMLLRQVVEITAPLKNLPPAQKQQLSAALLSVQTIRTEPGGKPTPQGGVAVLPDLVDAAVLSVTSLQ